MLITEFVHKCNFVTHHFFLAIILAFYKLKSALKPIRAANHTEYLSKAADTKFVFRGDIIFMTGVRLIKCGMLLEHNLVIFS